MPYKRNSELPDAIKNSLPEAGQTIWRKTFNAAYETYNGDEEKAIATAWASVKHVYEKKGDKWVLKKALSTISNFEPDGNVTGMTRWIPVARVGQVAQADDGTKFHYTKESLEAAAGDWSEIPVYINHTTLAKGENLRVLQAKFEDPMLYFEITPETEQLKLDANSTGTSIGTVLLKTDGDRILEFAPAEWSVLFPPFQPACNAMMGCSSTVEERTITYDLVKNNNTGQPVKVRTISGYLGENELADEERLKERLAQETSYFGLGNFKIYPEMNDLAIGDIVPVGLDPAFTVNITVSGIVVSSLQKESGKEIMGEGEEHKPVLFTEEQVLQRVKSAVEELKTNLENAHQVELQKISDTHAEELQTKEKEFSDAITAKEGEYKTSLETAKAEAVERVGLIAKIRTVFKPSEEASKELEKMSMEALRQMAQFSPGTGSESPTGVGSGIVGGEGKEGDIPVLHVGNPVRTGKWE